MNEKRLSGFAGEPFAYVEHAEVYYSIRLGSGTPICCIRMQQQPISMFEHLFNFVDDSSSAIRVSTFLIAFVGCIRSVNFIAFVGLL